MVAISTTQHNNNKHTSLMFLSGLWITCEMIEQ